MTERQRASFEMTSELKTGTARSLKNMFSVFWRFTCRARILFYCDKLDMAIG